MGLKLAENDWAGITEDMNGKTEMLTKKEVEKIATRLNKKIDIPVIDEKIEQKIFVKIVKKLDRYLYGVLPNEIYGLIRLADQGITEKEEQVLKDRLPTLLNKHINIPIIGEHAEREIISLFLDTVLEALKPDNKL